MNTKLTLSVDQKIIEEIKSYAKMHKVSLSKMVENYFNFVVHKAKPKDSNETNKFLAPFNASIFFQRPVPFWQFSISIISHN